MSATPQRERLPNRRETSTTVVAWRNFDGSSREYLVSFGWGPKGIREVFCTSPKSGSDEQAFINDSCIAISLLLQHGMTAQALAVAFGENRSISRPDAIGPPSSPLGAMAREAARIEKEFAQ